MLFRAHLVANSFAQIYGKNFNETYSHVTTFDAVRTVIANTASSNQHVHQFDVKTAFTKEDLTKETFLEIPQRFTADSNKILKLHKSIYELHP